LTLFISYRRESAKQRRLDWKKPQLQLVKVKAVKIRRMIRPRRFRLSNPVKKSEILTSNCRASTELELLLSLLFLRATETIPMDSLP
jgi:hypothetical protein